ncbi:lysine--tRNA ligase [bacterium]|nr:lysine--tRNA ligase [bacterium]
MEEQASGTAERMRREKEEKLVRLRELGREPYPHGFARSASAADCIANAEAWVAAETELALAGRLMSQRVMGKTSFGHLEDRSGSLQLFLRQDELGESYQHFVKLIEPGDHLGARGKLFVTRTGELSLRVSEWTLLAKAMLPLPEKYHGLTDPELRARQRYLDLAANTQVRRHFEKRSRILSLIRRFFEARGFLEVETPVLQPLYGGATARPFTTLHNALDTQLYLRIADELYLKRLIVGGMERVFEIGKIFRNEGMDRTHNPEFTMLEAYAAYWDYRDLLPLVETLYHELALAVGGGPLIRYGEHAIDLTPPWPRLDYYAALADAAGRDLRELPAAELAALAEAKGAAVDPRWSRGKLLDAIAARLVEPALIQPTFLVDHPQEISPLAKAHREKPGQVERFEPFIAGFEVGNAFSELNDPAEQRRRFEAQMGLRAKGDEEAQVLDEDFLRALAVGMPPTAGLGIGIDRLVMLLTDAHHIREVLLFPMMRPEARAEAPAEARDGD